MPWRTEIAAIVAICDCDAYRGPQKSERFPSREKAMLHCDLRVRCKVAGGLRFRAAISEANTPILWSPRQEVAMLHCDVRVRCKVAGGLRFWAAISETNTPILWSPRQERAMLHCYLRTR